MFEIQIWHRGQWQNDLASDYSKDNRFATMADAQAAMKDLIDIAIIILGGIPASDPRDSAVTYRVVEVAERAGYEMAIATDDHRCGGCGNAVSQGEEYGKPGPSSEIQVVCIPCIEIFEEEE